MTVSSTLLFDPRLTGFATLTASEAPTVIIPALAASITFAVGSSHEPYTEFIEVVFKGEMSLFGGETCNGRPEQGGRATAD